MNWSHQRQICIKVIKCCVGITRVSLIFPRWLSLKIGIVFSCAVICEFCSLVWQTRLVAYRFFASHQRQIYLKVIKCCVDTRVSLIFPRWLSLKIGIVFSCAVICEFCSLVWQTRLVAYRFSSHPHWNKGLGWVTQNWIFMFSCSSLYVLLIHFKLQRQPRLDFLPRTKMSRGSTVRLLFIAE